MNHHLFSSLNSQVPTVSPHFKINHNTNPMSFSFSHSQESQSNNNSSSNNPNKNTNNNNGSFMENSNNSSTIPSISMNNNSENKHQSIFQMEILFKLRSIKDYQIYSVQIIIHLITMKLYMYSLKIL